MVRACSSIGLVLAACAVVVGCGQSDDRDEVRGVAALFAAALADGDGASACAQLAPATVEALERQERRPCAEAIGALGVGGGAVEQVRVYVTNAQAVFGGGEVAFLDRTRAGWRLSAVGCRFEDGKPRDRPATCAVES